MSRSLYLSTRDCLNPLEPHRAKWLVPSLDLSNITQYGVRLKTFMMNNSVYAVNRFYDTINWTETDGSTPATYSATLTHQTYTGAQLATHIAALMTTESAAGLGDTYTGSYNSQTKFITITNTTGLPNIFNFNAVANNAYRIMGFTATDIASQAPAVSQTSVSMVDLAGTKYIDILSSSLSTANISSSSTSSTFARIPITTNIGSVIYYINHDSESLTLRSDNIEEIEIQLRDDEGNVYEMDENHHFSMVCEFKLKS